jgi:hypothetical protein
MDAVEAFMRTPRLRKSRRRRSGRSNAVACEDRGWDSAFLFSLASSRAAIQDSPHPVSLAGEAKAVG